MIVAVIIGAAGVLAVEAGNSGAVGVRVGGYVSSSCRAAASDPAAGASPTARCSAPAEISYAEDAPKDGASGAGERTIRVFVSPR